MSEREILLLDSDSKVRTHMADSFREAGYQVETTDSIVHALSTVLERHMPVVLLGSGSGRKIALSELVPLLKKCNRGVSIILVSDEESLSRSSRSARKGFYHALEPTGREDTEEIPPRSSARSTKPQESKEQVHHAAAKQEAARRQRSPGR
jgi:DNA-binding NtrC family response regulator